MEGNLARMTDSVVVPDLAGDLAALVAAPRYRPGPPCGVATILTRLGKDQPDAAAALAVSIDNETISASALADTLTRNGHPTSSQSVSRHRRRGQHNGCRCPR